jgi:hypothetical protein
MRGYVISVMGKSKVRSTGVAVVERRGNFKAGVV